MNIFMPKAGMGKITLGAIIHDLIIYYRFIQFNVTL